MSKLYVQSLNQVKVPIQVVDQTVGDSRGINGQHLFLVGNIHSVHFNRHEEELKTTFPRIGIWIICGQKAVGRIPPSRRLGNHFS